MAAKRRVCESCGERHSRRQPCDVLDVLKASMPNEPDEVLEQIERLHNRDRVRQLYQQFKDANRPVVGRVMDGTEFLADGSRVEAVWGSGDQVLQASGEGLLLTGPQGVGKSTVAQQHTLGRIGLCEDALGFPVVDPGDERTVFYLAIDRPEQIRRSLNRMVTGDDLLVIKKRLRVWKGPLPFDLTAVEPERFYEWVVELGENPSTLYLDSYKDLARRLSDEEVGQAINDTMQYVLAGGIEWLGIHHHRKPTGENRKPNKLDDVYGSTWLTAGCGSVVMLWGDPGSSRVELTHLKQPSGVVGPLTVNHSHAIGASVAIEPMAQMLSVLDARGEDGITEAEAADTLYGASDAADRKKARRLLNKLVAEKRASYQPGKSGGSDHGTPGRWWGL